MSSTSLGEKSPINVWPNPIWPLFSELLNQMSLQFVHAVLFVLDVRFVNLHQPTIRIDFFYLSGNSRCSLLALSDWNRFPKQTNKFPHPCGVIGPRARRYHHTVNHRV